jgi:hypothetical protein
MKAELLDDKKTPILAKIVQETIQLNALLYDQTEGETLLAKILENNRKLILTYLPTA